MKPRLPFGVFVAAAWLCLVFACDLSAQSDRVGWCYLNFGRLVEEPDYHVRAGNMGNENACAFADFELGRGFYAGGLIAYTRMFIWPRQNPEEVSRWSWRPAGDGARETAFAWIHPELGYRLDLGVLTLRPNLGVWWPAGTSYNWGAPVGIAPSAGLEVGLRLWRVEATVKGWYVRKGMQGWTVLHDWATEAHEIEREVSHIWPLSLGLSIRH